MKILVINTYNKRGEALNPIIYCGIDLAVSPLEMLELVKTEYANKVVLESEDHIGVEHFSGGSSEDIEHLDAFLLNHGYIREEVARISHIYSMA